MRSTRFCQVLSKHRKECTSDEKRSKIDEDIVICRFFSACNCIVSLAIARSQVTDILYLLHFSVTYCDHQSVSATTDLDVGESLICFKYQTLCMLSSRGPDLEFQPTHTGASPDCLLNVRSEVERKFCCCAFFKELGTLVCLSSVNGSAADFTILNFWLQGSMFKPLALQKRLLGVFPLVILLSVGTDLASICKSTLSLSFMLEALESLSK